MRRACETAKAVEEVLSTGDVDVHCDLCEVSACSPPSLSLFALPHIYIYIYIYMI